MAHGMATSSSLPSEKLRIDFGWMLNDVADYLSKHDCNKIAHAEQLPKSLFTPDSEDSGVTLLHTLQGRGKFNPLDPKGLIEMLKRLKKADAIEVVERYKSEQRYKEERERYKQEKKVSKKKGKQQIVQVPDSVPQNMEEFEKLLATAKVKSLTLIDTVMKALGTWENKVEQYRTGSIDIEEVSESFRKFSETLEKSGRTLQKDLSKSSLTSSSSDESQGELHNRYIVWYH